jgi:hypothetical protein
MGILVVVRLVIQMVSHITKIRVNREQELIKTFPLEDGTTYIQSLDKNLMCE